MIEIDYSKDLGIRLFQYAFATKLAQQWQFYLPPPPFLVSLRSPLVYKRKHLNPVWIIDGHQPRDAELNRRLRQSDLRTPPGCKVRLTGAFEDVTLAPDALNISSFEMPAISMENNSAIVLCRTRVALQVRHESGVMISSTQYITEPTVEDIRVWAQENCHRKITIVIDVGAGQFWDRAKEQGWQVILADGWQRISIARRSPIALITENAIDWWATALSVIPETTVLERKIDRPCLTGKCREDLTVQTGWPKYRLKDHRLNYRNFADASVA